MSQKDFILDVIVNKLHLDNDRVEDTKNLLVKFSFNDINLDITTSRINVADFGEGRSIEFSSTLDDLKRKLKENPLKLIILSSEKSVMLNGNSAADAVQEDGVEELEEAVQKKTKSNIIGEVSCFCPKDLIDKLKDDCTDVVPYVQNCDITLDGDDIGKITLAIMLHCKCDEEKREYSQGSDNVPYVNKHGRLVSFEEVSKEIDKDDTFFVIGRQPEPVGDPVTEILERSPFLRKQKFPVRLDTDRYKLMRGALIKDCDFLEQQPCGIYDCCNNWYEPPENASTKPLILAAKRKRRPCPNRCENIFGTNNDVIAEKEERADTEMRNERRRNSYRPDFCSCKASGRCKSSKNFEDREEELQPSKLLVNILKERLEQYESEKKPAVRTPAPDPKTKILPSRYCPVCCQNLTLNEKNASCPKCGHRPSSRITWHKSLTADDILEQWDSDEKEFIEKKGFSQYDHCTCDNGKECIYCRIRKMCDKVKDYGPGNESLYTGVERDSLLRTCNENSEPDDQKICDELIEKYGRDSEPDVQLKKMWKGSPAGQPRLSKVLDLLKGQLSSRKKSLEDDKSAETRKKRTSVPSKCIDLKDLREERIREMMEDLCKEEPVEIKPQRWKPKTKSQFIKEMERKYGRRYCYPKRKKQRIHFRSHHQCATENDHVPAKMGWLWNLDKNLIKKGWRPGKIRKPIRELMTYFLTEFPVDSLPTTQELAALVRPPLDPPDEEKLVQKPTLHIRKRDGQYLITMNPLKNEKTLRYSADPYANTKPIEFKITKDPIAMKRREVKRYLKRIGFKKCSCQQPISKCLCRSYMEKQRLENSLGSICDLVQATSLKEAICLSDTTESDSQLDIEFTPPAGVIKPHLKVKPDVAETCTQYNTGDFISKINKRTEQLIRQEAQHRKRHFCEGAIQTKPCAPKPRPIRKKRKQESNLGIAREGRNTKQLGKGKSREIPKTANVSRDQIRAVKLKEITKVDRLKESIKNKSKEIVEDGSKSKEINASRSKDGAKGDKSKEPINADKSKDIAKGSKSKEMDPPKSKDIVATKPKEISKDKSKDISKPSHVSKEISKGGVASRTTSKTNAQ